MAGQRLTAWRCSSCGLLSILLVQLRHGCGACLGVDVPATSALGFVVRQRSKALPRVRWFVPTNRWAIRSLWLVIHAPRAGEQALGVVRLRCLDKFPEDLQVAHRFETSVQSQSNLWPAVDISQCAQVEFFQAMACAAIPRDIS